MTNQYITPQALAAILGKSIRTIRRWKQQGYLPPYTMPGLWNKEAIKTDSLLRLKNIRKAEQMSI